MSKKNEQLEPLSMEEQAESLNKLNRLAVETLRHLLQKGSEHTRLRASMWLLDRMEAKSTPADGLRRDKFGEIRIGFDDEVTLGKEITLLDELDIFED